MSKKGASTETQVSAKPFFVTLFIFAPNESQSRTSCSAITAKLLKALLQQHQAPPLFRQKPFL